MKKNHQTGLNALMDRERKRMESFTQVGAALSGQIKQLQADRPSPATPSRPKR